MRSRLTLISLTATLALATIPAACKTAAPIESSTTKTIQPASDGEAEIHVQICGSSASEAITALGYGSSSPALRDTYFFDDRNLSLYDRGVILRVINEAGSDPVSDAKLRPIDFASIPRDWSDEDNLKCEVDIYGVRAMPGCRFRHYLEASDLAKVLRGSKEPRSLFGRKQESLIEETKNVTIADEELLTYGPVFIQRWEPLDGSESPDQPTLELWLLGDRVVTLEVSLRAPLRSAHDVSVALETRLRSLGINVCEDLQPKTKMVLQSIRGF